MKKGRLANFWLEDQIPCPLPTFKWFEERQVVGYHPPLIP
jgi:hypothetical protein